MGELVPGTAVQYLTGSFTIEIALRQPDGRWLVTGLADAVDTDGLMGRTLDFSDIGVTVVRDLTTDEAAAIEKAALERAANYLDNAPLNAIADPKHVDKHSSDIRRQRIYMSGIAEWLRSWDCREPRF